MQHGHGSEYPRRSMHLSVGFGVPRWIPPGAIVSSGDCLFRRALSWSPCAFFGVRSGHQLAALRRDTFLKRILCQLLESKSKEGLGGENRARRCVHARGWIDTFHGCVYIFTSAILIALSRLYIIILHVSSLSSLSISSLYACLPLPSCNRARPSPFLWTTSPTFNRVKKA